MYESTIHAPIGFLLKVTCRMNQVYTSAQQLITSAYITPAERDRNFELRLQTQLCMHITRVSARLLITRALINFWFLARLLWKRARLQGERTPYAVVPSFCNIWRSQFHPPGMWGQLHMLLFHFYISNGIRAHHAKWDRRETLSRNANRGHMPREGH
jgi:hypothetical protein